MDIIGAVLSIVAFVLPLLYDAFFSQGRKVESGNEKMDKALADGNSDDIARLLSARVDRVRGTGASSAGQPGDN
ncbi:MAG TPA: hypothetical protein VLH56_13475 [Dissulfurispiraceae bacterium]|nr:hypothetical protein [Dissulfurispiraceae bacterium]